MRRSATAALLLLVLIAVTARAQDEPSTRPSGGAEAAEAAEGAEAEGRVVDLVISAGAFTMPATLELPAAAEPVPCVLLISGSGPTDRDWNSAAIPGDGNGSGAQLAAALRAQGIGSLRYDKIASGENATPLEQLSMQQYLDEGTAAYRHLSDLEACGPIVVLGHSEGAMHALRLVQSQQEAPDFGGLVLMSGPSESLVDTIAGQLRQPLLASGHSEEQVEAALSALREGVVGLPGTIASPPDFGPVSDLALFWQQLVMSGPPDLLRDLLTFDPLEAAATYRGPVLVVSAAHDIQIGEAEGDALLAAIPEGDEPRRRVTIAEANHVYKHETRTPADTDLTSLMMAYWEEGRPLAPGLVDALVAFVAEASP